MACCPCDCRLAVWVCHINNDLTSFISTGHNANPSERKEAMKTAEGFIKQMGYPANTKVHFPILLFVSFCEISSRSIVNSVAADGPTDPGAARGR